MAKSLAQTILNAQKKYGCRTVSVTFYSPGDSFPEGWWGANATGITNPAEQCVSAYGTNGDGPKEALAKLCQKLDELLDKQEAPARFQAASAAQLKRAA